MKVKIIILFFILGQIIGLIGVALFISSNPSKDVSRFLMVVGLILNATWVIGLAANLYKRYIK